MVSEKMDAGRIFLLMLFSLVCIFDQRHGAPVHAADVFLLIPEPGIGPGGMQLARLIRPPLPPGMMHRNSASMPFVPPTGRLVVLMPNPTPGRPSGQSAVQQKSLQVAGSGQKPPVSSSDVSLEKRQSITPQNRNEAEPQNKEQSIDTVNKTAAAADSAAATASNSTDLPFLFPVKVNGATGFMLRNVSVPVAVAVDENQISGQSGDESAGSSLNGLTRSELSTLIRETVQEILRQEGHLKATSSPSVSSRSGDQSGESATSDRDGGSEPTEAELQATSAEAGAAAAAQDERSGPGSESREPETETKARRQLPDIRRKKPGKKKFRSEESGAGGGGHPGVLSIFKPISTTPDPEAAVSPVDQPDMMDPGTTNDFQDELLRNKQIVIVGQQDRDKHKNQLFLKALREILLDFEQMYEIPHQEDEPHTLPQIHSSSTVHSDSLETTSHTPTTTTIDPVTIDSVSNGTEVTSTESSITTTTAVPLN